MNDVRVGLLDGRRADPARRREERGRELRRQLFLRIVVAPKRQQLGVELAIEAGAVPGGVCKLVEERGVVGLALPEAFRLGHPHEVLLRCVEHLVPPRAGSAVDSCTHRRSPLPPR